MNINDLEEVTVNADNSVDDVIVDDADSGSAVSGSDDSKQKDTSERPDYLPEEYWDNGNANLEKLSRDFLKEKEKAEGLRKKLSNPKVEDYESVFDDIEMNEDASAKAKEYAAIAKKHGISKTQAEALLKDVAESQVVGDAENAQTTAEIKQELGENAKEILGGLEEYGTSMVKSGKWTDAELNAYSDMVYDAKSARLMSQLLQNQKDGAPDLSGKSSSASSGMTRGQYEIGVAQCHRLIAQGEREKAEEMRRDLDMRARHLFDN